MTDLHARIDVLEGELTESLAGAGVGLLGRTFAVLRLMRGDGTTGMGEASPLPGYSPDLITEVCEELRRLTNAPVRADPLESPRALLIDALTSHPLQHPSARFAFETALLDWLGRTRGKPVHQILAGEAERQPIPIADLISESSHLAWPSRVDELVADGATHIKLKIGRSFDAEIEALETIRRTHPTVALRLDANRRLTLDALRRHAASLEALALELIEEPVAPEQWRAALDLPLPFALDETLRDESLSERLLETNQIRAVVIKPMVLGGLGASLAIAERATAHGTRYLVSHTFDGPIARAATAELALALQTELAAGLGLHPALALWPRHRIAAIRGREITPHDEPGLGVHLEEDTDG